MAPAALGGVEPQAHLFIQVPIDHGVTGTDMQPHLRDAALDFPEVACFIRRKNEGGLGAPERVASAVLHSLVQPTLALGADYPTDAGAA